jgi:hypothetical protein
MIKEGNKYLFELHSTDSKPIKDTVEECIDLEEAINKIKNIYDLKNKEFTGLNLELLRRGN